MLKHVNCELQDDRIIEAVKKAVDLFDDGEIIEFRNTLEDIVPNIDKWLEMEDMING